MTIDAAVPQKKKFEIHPKVISAAQTMLERYTEMASYGQNPIGLEKTKKNAAYETYQNGLDEFEAAIIDHHTNILSTDQRQLVQSLDESKKGIEPLGRRDRIDAWAQINEMVNALGKEKRLVVPKNLFHDGGLLDSNRMRG